MCEILTPDRDRERVREWLLPSHSRFLNPESGVTIITALTLRISHSRFSLPILKVTPETAPEPAPDPEFSGSGVRIGIDFSNFQTHSRFSESHSRNGSRNGSRSRSGVRISGSGVRIGIYSRSMSMSCLSSCKSHSRFSLPIPIPIFLLKVTPDFVRKSGVTQK